ncbi:MAG: hypothetical protein DI620_00805 [Haemophilus parainfluenzae]|jgi:deoxyguanosine kinase|nr:MAG: hypothetical protein DI620_00805 [Haemophilus parainfluenzae]
MKQHYLVVEGCIGTEKTELAEKLAFFFDALFIKEDYGENSFLSNQLKKPKQHALAGQLQFLLDHIRQSQEINDQLKSVEKPIISDFLLAKDHSFVSEILPENEVFLYWQLRSHLIKQEPIPDLVLFLDPSLESLERHMGKQESQRNERYSMAAIERFYQSYQRFFYLYEDAPALIANTDELDFIYNKEHFDLLIQTLTHLEGKKNYLTLQ